MKSKIKILFGIILIFLLFSCKKLVKEDYSKVISELENLRKNLTLESFTELDFKNLELEVNKIKDKKVKETLNKFLNKVIELKNNYSSNCENFNKNFKLAFESFETEKRYFYFYLSQANKDLEKANIAYEKITLNLSKKELNENPKIKNSLENFVIKEKNLFFKAIPKINNSLKEICFDESFVKDYNKLVELEEKLENLNNLIESLNESVCNFYIYFDPTRLILEKKKIGFVFLNATRDLEKSCNKTYLSLKRIKEKVNELIDLDQKWIEKLKEFEEKFKEERKEILDIKEFLRKN